MEFMQEFNHFNFLIFKLFLKGNLTCRKPCTTIIHTKINMKLNLLDRADDIPGCTEVSTPHTVVDEGPDRQALHVSVLHTVETVSITTHLIQ